MNVKVKTVLTALIILIVVMQAQLWFSKGGVPTLYKLNRQIDLQVHKNAFLKRRNKQLMAEIEDLNQGTAGLESFARGKLGMIKQGESFFVIIDRH